MIEMEHGTFRAFQRHRREKTEPCDLCKAARRGYEHGYKNAVANTEARFERASHSSQLTERALNVCRGLVLRRPPAPLRELAVAIIREADAELAGEDPTWRAVA